MISDTNGSATDTASERAPATAAESTSESFARQAEEDAPGIITEFVDFLKYNKKWWLTPIIVGLLVVGVLVVLGSTAAGPFIYTLF